MKVREFFRKHSKEIRMLVMVLVLSIMLLRIANVPVFADVGNNNRYGEDSISSGGYEDSGDFYIIFMILDLVFDLFGPIGGIIVAILIFIGYRMLKKSKTNFSTIPMEEQGHRDFSHISESDIERKIQAFDPMFSAEDMKQKVSECFVFLQKAWTERKWEHVRPFESDALFSMHQAQLEEYIRNGTINVVERIKITSTKLIDFEVSGERDILQVELKASMKDYIIDEKSKEVVEGNKTRDFFTTYRMEFVRSHGSLTQAGKEITTTNCPNCGAPTAVTSSGQCEYCDSVITNGHHGWVLNELTTM